MKSAKTALPSTPGQSPGTRPAFDPGAAAGPDSGIFGLSDSAERARVHVLGVPFDATTSFHKGAANGPLAILRASRQVDLFDLLNGKPYEAGIWMAPLDPRVSAWNEEATRAAAPVIAAGGVGEDPSLLTAARKVDAIQEELNRWVETQARAALEAGKLLALVGGDHSVPFGSIQAHAERYPGLGLLHFDAHADLRAAYEGFTWSHASILRNVVERIPRIERIVQVGIRDLSEDEFELIQGTGGRVQALFDHEWADARHSGHVLKSLVRRTLEPLPAQVYVTFDVDGLDPSLCPHTGTPVPGGLSWSEAMLWLEELVLSGRTIVGLDLNEVAPEAGQESGAGWDENVGARLLYRLIGFALRSCGA